MCMCVYVENTAMASSVKNYLFADVCVCICWESLLNQCYPCLSLSGSGMPLLIKFLIIYTFVGN